MRLERAQMRPAMESGHFDRAIAPLKVSASLVPQNRPRRTGGARPLQWAFELARSGKCVDTSEIGRHLKKEGLAQVDELLCPLSSTPVARFVQRGKRRPTEQAQN